MMTTIVYNSANIQAWQNELPALAYQIQENTRLVTEHNNVLIPLHSKNQVLQSQINSVQLQINLAELRNSQDRNYHYHHHHHHQSGFLHTAGDVLATINTIALYSQLNGLRGQEAQLVATMQPHIRQVDSGNAIISQSRSRSRWLTTHISEGNQFLQNIRNNPLGLITSLQHKIDVEFKFYDDNNSAGRSPQVRICLLNLAAKLKQLSPAEHADNKTTQLKYLQLCAFIYEMHRQVALENQDHAFQAILAGLIDTTHIAQQGDLPDELQTGISVASHFNTLQQNNVGLF